MTHRLIHEAPNPHRAQPPRHLYLLATTAGTHYSLRAASLGDAVATAKQRGYFTGGLQLGHEDLSGTALSRLDLAGSWLYDARLCGADLSESDLSGVHAFGASFTGANLRGARLAGAHLICADFAGADLSGADLRRTNLRATGMEGARLGGALLAYTTVGRALTQAQVFAADTGAIRLDLFDRLQAVPGLAGRLEGALRGGFIGTPRGRLPDHAVTGAEIGPEWVPGTLPPVGAARHWLADVDPHTPVTDPRVTLILSLLAEWNGAAGKDA